VEAIESFPEELRVPLARLIDALRAELSVQRSDFEELKAVVRELAEAQRRTEERVGSLEAAVERLAEAQRRTEERVGELAQAQKRTEERVGSLEAAVERLAEAQSRTDERLERLEAAVERLAEAQLRTDERVGRLETAVERLAEAQTRFERTFTVQIGGLGARWGMQSEEAFRTGMRTILQDVGLRTERFLKYDSAGEVFGQPDQVELDIVIQNGRTLVVEIKSAVERGDVYLFARKAQFYNRESGRTVDRRLMITPFAESSAKEVALRLGVEICSDINALP
jgi:hypothetical protein